MYRFGLLAACGLLICASWTWARPDRSARTYVLTIDGQDFDLVEGTARAVTLKGGQTHTVQVRPKALQRLRVGVWAFDYPADFSVDRDEDGDVTLMNGAGIAVLVFAQGTGDVDHARLIHTETMKEYEKLKRLEVARDLTVSKPVEATLSRAVVLRSTLEYIDHEDDKMVFDLSTFQAKGQIVTVMVTYQKPQGPEARKAANVVFDSLTPKG